MRPTSPHIMRWVNVIHAGGRAGGGWQVGWFVGGWDSLSLPLVPVGVVSCAGGHRAGRATSGPTPRLRPASVSAISTRSVEGDPSHSLTPLWLGSPSLLRLVSSWASSARSLRLWSWPGRFECPSRSAIRLAQCNPNAETSSVVERHRSSLGICGVEGAEDSGDYSAITAHWRSKSRFLPKIFIEIFRACEGKWHGFQAGQLCDVA
jgi:hypothetical protein